MAVKGAKKQAIGASRVTQISDPARGATLPRSLEDRKLPSAA
jgi:hypothetical protein